MIKIKTNEEIEKMEKGGHILAQVLRESMKMARPGVSEKELDELADRLITKHGGKAGFKMVDGYKNATCISTNNVVVHGIPSDYKLKPGDIIGIDCGVYYAGFHTDMSDSIVVGDEKNFPEESKFLKKGKFALDQAIEKAVIGNRVGHISQTIQDIVEGTGYSVVRSLVGHGVGKQLHEDPEVPGFLDVKIEKTPVLKEGMTIAIEVIYNMGESDVVYSNDDGWTISTKDGSLSGLFERTVAITKDGPLVLTA
jgi:methionyl aminopeptidase